MDPTISTAPWWYVAALAGGFTILGGFITLIGSYFSDKRRFKLEDLRHWDDAIVEVAVDLYVIAEKMAGSEHSGPASLDLDPDSDVRPPDG